MDAKDFEIIARKIPPGVSYSYSGGDTVYREEDGVITEIPVHRDELPNTEAKKEQPGGTEG